MPPSSPFDTLDQVRARTSEAILGQSGLNHAGLAAEIRARLSSRDPRVGGLLQEPWLESALPYVSAETTLGELSGGLLHPSLVDALEGANTPGRDHRFPRERRPYLHQLRAWETLADPAMARSVLVTSGTGSGKTECFLIPILDDLARQAEATAGRLEGVQAVVLYPLNALIASQEERLRAWTSPFDGRLRFALYNGMLEPTVRARDGADRPETVADRRALRASPPPILVTNVTMLEYMLLRAEDAPILRASQGKLRYVVLDEAHSYVGAQAAEIALLLRRVCLAFGVEPAEVRFIATSATIGGGPRVEDDLRSFLADVSGAPESSVAVITGRTSRPALPPLHAGGPLADGWAGDGAFLRLGGHPRLRPVIERLHAGAVGWSELIAAARSVDAGPAALATALAESRSEAGEALAPLRIHGFHRAMPGLWSCLDPACTLPRPADWPFGAIRMQMGDLCGCGAPLLEIVHCAECGEPFLEALETGGEKLVRPARARLEDEFAADADHDGTEAEEAEGGAADDLKVADELRLLAVRPGRPGSRLRCVESRSGELRDREGVDGVNRVILYDRDGDCPACGASGRPGAAVVRPLRFGAPFILGAATPVLLDDAARPAEADDPKTWADQGGPPPMGGRQLLSFTDSRQGTARFAAKLQTASERNHVRSVIFHAVQDALRQAGDAEAIARETRSINALTPIADTDPGLQDALSQAMRRRDALLDAGRAGLPWASMVERLAERDEVRLWMREVWDKRDALFVRPETLAEFLLLREFRRRPPRANSVETLGLARLRYEAIDRLPDAAVPAAFVRLGGAGQDWRDYLTLLTVHLARGRTAVRVSREMMHWIPPKAFTRDLVFRPEGKLKAWEVGWPRLGPGALGRLPMVVTLLEQATGRSFDEPDVRQTAQEVLDVAWSAIGPLLTEPGSQSRQLDFRKAHVAPLTQAWFCPVTRRVLDVAFRGFSPYGAKTRGTPGILAEAMAAPRHPAVFRGEKAGLTRAEGDALVRAWLADDPAVSALRAKGAWNDLSDRIALFSDYFRSAEHSAQQSPRRLRGYEKAFKAGAINVLNCSTTMEMGVDIGSVSHVMMTNLPPSIANYRQRVGRAGRRGQAMSLAFTFCKDRPLDREAFRDPASYLSRTIQAPKVALNSTVIVQRHVNALLFAAFVREAGSDALKMHAGPFFGCNMAIGAPEELDSPAARFAAWARRPATREALTAQVDRLTARTALAGDRGLHEAAAVAMETARDAFAAEWGATQTLAIGAAQDAKARQSLSFQLQRQCQDYLLGALASRGVLPGHGFPTDVVSFIVRKDRPHADAGGGEERSRFAAYPQRSLDVAIREYAPGSEVVLDGLVHRSAGVTLNWKRPASPEGLRDIQALKVRWSCPRCGESGTVARFDPERRECPACLAAVARWDDYLQPAGFAVDLREDPHADADVVTFVPPEPTVVSARGEPWRAFSDPAAGRMRASRSGSVFYCNAGPTGQGYAICLDCGRADAPAGKAHAPLLGSGGECPGSFRSYARKESLRLGHEISTDVCELQPAGWAQPGAALALAVALREALARRLGVEPSEMGVATARRLDANGAVTASLFLFDKAAGGAGFAGQILEQLAELIVESDQVLDCRAPGCVSGCPACVLAGDLSDSEAASLDRLGARALIAERLATEGAPSAIDVAGPGARLVDDAAACLTLALEGGGRALAVWMPACDPVLLEDGPLAKVADQWRARGRPVSLTVSAGWLRELDDAGRLRLRDAVNRLRVELREGDAPRFANNALTLAEATLANGHALVLASRDPSATSPGPGWGRPNQTAVVRFEAGSPSAIAPSVLLSRLQPRPGAAVGMVDGELDGRIDQFGQRAAALLRRLLARIGFEVGTPVASLLYEDRYLRAPLPLKLALDTFGALARPGGGTPLSVLTRPLEPRERAQYLDDDWRQEDDRAQVAGALARGAGLQLELRIGDAGHARRLRVDFQDGRSALILFDQGFGAWRAPRGTRFEFRDRPSEQGARLRGLRIEVGLPTGSRTYIVAQEA